MNIETIFSIVNTVALISWTLLILLPKDKREYFYKSCHNLVFPILGLLYSVLIFSFFSSSGGGFDSLASVKQLLSNDWVLLAGWIHYLIFDLFVGIYIAKNLDERNVPKIFQSFFLVLTFMFGPAGLLVYFLFNQIIKFTNKYIYLFYPVDWRLDFNNKVYSYALYAWAFSFALWPMIFVASFLDGRTIADVNVWTKPLKFIYAFGIQFATILLVLPLLQKKYLESKFLVWISVIAAYSLVLEIIYISIQALRGRASHFNDLTQLESTMYGLMGIGAVLGIIGSFVIGYYIFKYARENVSFGVRFSVGIGLMLGSVLTFIVAGYLGGNGSHFIDKSFQNIALLPIMGWSTIYGDLRVPHFFATHTMQFLPLVGLLTLYLNKRYERLLVYAATALCVFIVLFTFWQALNNIPFIVL